MLSPPAKISVAGCRPFTTPSRRPFCLWQHHYIRGVQLAIFQIDGLVKADSRPFFDLTFVDIEMEKQILCALIVLSLLRSRTFLPDLAKTNAYS